MRNLARGDLTRSDRVEKDRIQVFPGIASKKWGRSGDGVVMAWCDLVCLECFFGANGGCVIMSVVSSRK